MTDVDEIFLQMFKKVDKRKRCKVLMNMIMEQIDFDDNLKYPGATLDTCLQDWEWSLDNEEQCSQLFYSTMSGMMERLDRELKNHIDFLKAGKET